MIQVANLFLSLSFLIILHELGHFIPARFFKTRVEKFYLFFDPWFSLFKFKRGDTEYGIGWIPFGGYVKISGMVDESMDKEQMKKPPQPWELRSKPVWQRLIIMAGGVTVNVILGVLIYSMVLFAWGEEYLPTKNAKFGIVCDSIAREMGFRDGDKILSVDNKEVENFNKIPMELILNKAKTVQIDRNGEKREIAIEEEAFSNIIKNKSTLFDPAFPCVVDSIIPGSAADKGGLKKGDKIVAVNNETTNFFPNVVQVLQRNKDKSAELRVLRGSDTVLLKTQVSGEGKLGFLPTGPDKYLTMSIRSYGFFESFPAGINKGAETISGYLKQIKILLTVKDAHKSIGGFYTFSKAFGNQWDWPRFWSLTAFISIVLAIMNLLPIPGLDGGYIMFLLFEMISGVKVSDKVVEYANYAGMLLLLTLMVYANTDFLRH